MPQEHSDLFGWDRPSRWATTRPTALERLKSVSRNASWTVISERGGRGALKVLMGLPRLRSHLVFER